MRQVAELSIIVPAYNEEGSLRVFLPELLEYCGAHNMKLIVVNDASEDGTSELLKEYNETQRFRILTHKVNRGYGGAIKTGIRHADTRYVITIDADGQHDPNDIMGLLSLMQESDADMIVGSRMETKGTSVYRGIGKWLIRSIARLLLPIHIQDINSGMKIYDTNLAQRYIRLCPDHMAFSDIITMVFISEKHLVLEQDINIRPRTVGTSTITTLTAIETVMEILNIVVLFNPMRIFFPIAILFIVGSLAWGVPIVLDGRGVSTGAMLGFTTGMLFFFLGLIAEQLSQIRINSVAE